MNIPTPIKQSSVLLLAIAGMIGSVFGQNDPLISSNGAMFYINGGPNDAAVVWVDGTVSHNAQTMVNLGRFIIKGDYINNAQSGGDGTNSSIPPNHGTFEVFGNWDNNGDFYAGGGLVRFMATDTILGSSVTTFHDVELVGDIRRIQFDIDAEIDETGVLDLDVGEWATDFNTLAILGSSTGAIVRETNCDPCGYVSSLENGYLSRATDQNTGYLFPVGSTLDVSPNQSERYRPLILTPGSDADDTFSVRFVNRDATINSLPIVNVDPSICYVNPGWYHRVNQLGGANATASLAMHAAPFDGDADFNTVANWSAANNEWENMNEAANGTVNFWNQVVRNDWDDFQPGYPEDAYILGFKVPEAPQMSGDTSLCADVEETYTVPVNGSDYDFVVTGGTVVNQTNNSVTVIWDNDSLFSLIGTVQIIETVPNNVNGGCASIPLVQLIEIYSLPIANFTVAQADTNLPNDFFIHDILEVLDVSINTVEWSWGFDDGVTSTDSLPFHAYYDIGTYDIQLITTSDLGCLDTLAVAVNIVEGIIIPNVFTPNNDGWNDAFDVRTSDIGEFDMEIYNRWGNLVYANTSPQISWDGTNQSGAPVPAGTYFYVITKAELNSGNPIDNELSNFDFQENGWLTLIR